MGLAWEETTDWEILQRPESDAGCHAIEEKKEEEEERENEEEEEEEEEERINHKILIIPQ
jgi:hypothetical protein